MGILLDIILHGARQIGRIKKEHDEFEAKAEKQREEWDRRQRQRQLKWDREYEETKAKIKRDQESFDKKFGHIFKEIAAGSPFADPDSIREVDEPEAVCDAEFEECGDREEFSRFEAREAEFKRFEPRRLKPKTVKVRTIDVRPQGRKARG